MDAAFIESYYQTYNSEDPAALSAFYHEDVVLASSAGEQQGLQAIIDTYRFLIGQFHDKMTPDNIAIEGDTAIVDITDVFTAKKDVEDFMGQSLKAGESFELKLRGTYKIVDGKFKRIDIEMLAE